MTPEAVGVRRESDERPDAAAPLDARIDVRRGGRFTLDAAVTVAEAGTLAIMGPSGAGKSTLLGALAGLVPLAGGYVRLGGRDLSTPHRLVEPAARDTVLLGQDPRLFPHLSAQENVAFGLRSRGVPRRAAHARADALLARVGLPDAGPHRPAELSGGQQQRVALARAVAASPRLVLLDEPLTSLDPRTAAEIRVVLADLLRHVTCVLVTHDAVDAVALADRLLVLEEGRATQTGDTRTVLAAPETSFVAGLTGVNVVSGTVRGGVWSAGAVGIPAVGMPDGDAVAVFPPDAVRIAGRGTSEPGLTVHGTARVTRVEQTLSGVRIAMDDPALGCAVPFEAWAQHPIVPGDLLELALDPERVRFHPRPAGAM
jgi:molybdate transport system ATP-binding protein